MAIINGKHILTIVSADTLARKMSNTLINYTIPNDVTGAIINNEFEGCTNLKTIVIGNGITTISNRAFYGCTKLENITVGTSVTSIGGSAFRNCSKLKTIILPAVTSISTQAFYGCTLLSDITLNYNGVVTLETEAAIPQHTTPIKIHVPAGQIASYQAANKWINLYNNGYVTFVAIE